MFSNLLHPEVQKFIRDHEGDDPADIALKGSPFQNLSAPQLIDQIAGLSKIKDKVPTYYRAHNIVFPPSVNLEQSSSESTAKFKAELISGAKQIVDLTGGFGIDSFFFSQHAENVIYIEPNPNLLEIAQHNHQSLGSRNIEYRRGTAEEFVTNMAAVDLVYVDPSRRVDQQKVFTLEDCQPNVVALQSSIMQHTPRLLIKASPLLDIKLALRQLQFVKEVYALAVDNEVKELLFLVDRSFNDESLIHAINLRKETRETFSFKFSDEEQMQINYASPVKYLYEPNAAVLKAGAFKSVSSSFNLSKLHVSTHLYTSSELNMDFPGRVFEILAFIKPDRKDAAKHIASGKANVISRNHPLKAEDLKRRVGVQDGGDQYIIGFTGQREKYVAVAARIK